MSLGVGTLASCAGQQLQPPPQTAMVRPVPPPQPEPTAPLRAAPRPARKPDTPAPIEGPAPETQDEALAMTVPKPSEGALRPEALSPPPGPTTPSTSASPTALPAPQTNQLIGLDQPTATRLLGAAVERSDEPPAMVWHYKNGTCELDLFFYLDLRSGRMRTLHYAFKGASDKASRQDCLRSLFAARGD
jgi:hypothetical protein